MTPSESSSAVYDLEPPTVFPFITFFNRDASNLNEAAIIITFCCCRPISALQNRQRHLFSHKPATERKMQCC